MARINVPAPPAPTPTTHEGGRAARSTPAHELQRAVMSCLLWEDTFYEDGVSIADRIAALVPQCDPTFVANLAREARTSMNLRHVPLLLCRELARHGHLHASTLSDCIQRPDELTEFLAIYWKDKKQPIAAQAKKGLADAFRKFNEYSLAKYNRKDAIKLRDVLFLCHAKPKDNEQDALWKRLIAGELQTPDTWEVAISASHINERPAIWTRLLIEQKLGALALLRNLRNLIEAKVEDRLISTAIDNMDTSKVLPFRFIAAARYAPRFEPELETALFRNLSAAPRLSGTTALLIDVSGSMEDPLSLKSDMRRIDAACGLGIIVRELCPNARIFTFSDRMVEVPPRRGFALRDAIMGSQPHRGTYLARAITAINQIKPDRLIVISDEQSQDGSTAPVAKLAYMLNVGTYQNGVAHKNHWTTISGFSESCVRYISLLEAHDQ